MHDKSARWNYFYPMRIAPSPRLPGVPSETLLAASRGQTPDRGPCHRQFGGGTERPGGGIGVFT